MMGQRASTNWNKDKLSRRDAAFLWLAVACVALMPSIYRGGAEVPHPHSFFQFWFSGPEAAFNHHGGEGDEGHVHSGLHHVTTVDSRCGALVGYDAFACP